MNWLIISAGFTSKVRWVRLPPVLFYKFFITSYWKRAKVTNFCSFFCTFLLLTNCGRCAIIGGPRAGRIFHYNICCKICQAKFCTKLHKIFSQNLCNFTIDRICQVAKCTKFLQNSSWSLCNFTIDKFCQVEFCTKIFCRFCAKFFQEKSKKCLTKKNIDAIIIIVKGLPLKRAVQKK